MPENKVQDAITKMAESLEPKAEETNPNDSLDPKKGIVDPPPSDGLVKEAPAVEETEEDKQKKRDSAFATIRIENARLAKENEELKKNKPLENANEIIKPPVEEASQETDLEKRLNLLEKRNQELITRERQTQMYSQLSLLSKTYDLKREDLIKFAEDADKKGFNLNDTNLTMVDVYRVVYHNDIIAQEVAKVQAEIAGNNAPGPGPTGTGTGGTARSARDVIKSVAEKLPQK